MFGIVLMGILTSYAEGFVELVEELVRAIVSSFGVFVSIPLGFVEGFEYITALCGQIFVALLRAATFGLL